MEKYQEMLCGKSRADNEFKTSLKLWGKPKDGTGDQQRVDLRRVLVISFDALHSCFT